MGLAFGQLRLAPDHFWRMSPCELQAALDGYYGGGWCGAMPQALNRSEFDALCAQFPDQGIENGDQ